MSDNSYPQSADLLNCRPAYMFPFVCFTFLNPPSADLPTCLLVSLHIFLHLLLIQVLTWWPASISLFICFTFVNHPSDDLSIFWPAYQFPIICFSISYASKCWPDDLPTCPLHNVLHLWILVVQTCQSANLPTSSMHLLVWAISIFILLIYLFGVLISIGLLMLLIQIQDNDGKCPHLHKVVQVTSLITGHIPTP